MTDSIATEPGRVIAGRFEIQTLAACGGMAMVYRAYDRGSRQLVALKVLGASLTSPAQRERFEREADILRTLRHRSIVAYVAHGFAENEQPYLAMEWVAGETLEQRLEHHGVTLAETLAVIRQVAEALGLLHERGIMHRDLKPSNLILRDGRIEDVVLLDFGLAQERLGSMRLTRTGELFGTLEYLPPERVRSESTGAAGDVYSLGCMLYECLTGAPPFVGPHPAAILARLLHDETPRLERLRPELPPGLSALVGQMLAKAPAERPADGMAVLAALDALDIPDELGSERVTLARAAVGQAEQRLFCITLVTTRERTPAEADTDLLRAMMVAWRPELEALVVPFQGQVHMLGLAGFLLTFNTPGITAEDQAVKAVRAALTIVEQRPDLSVSVTMERWQAGRSRSVDATAPVVEAHGRSIDDRRAESATGIVVDDLTAVLMAGRFVLQPLGEGAWMVEGERIVADPMRPLLGRPTPCLGRERELRLLESLWHSCITEEQATVALVLGEGGLGKSRLCHELVRRIVEEDGEEPLIVHGRGDLMQTRSSHALLNAALRQLGGIERLTDPQKRQQALFARLGRHLEAEERPATLEFLGELCLMPLAQGSAESARLRAARQDPQLMKQHLLTALVDFLRAECRVHPVLIVLEDLHWADVASLQLLDAALRQLSEHPVMVLGFARPELRERYALLWERRALHEVRLGGLSRKASERLIYEVLGADAVPAAMVAHLVDQAGGNPLLLEELIRAVAEGSTADLPGTVVALMESRLLRLDTQARQLLRAASIFGQHFWKSGVETLVQHPGQSRSDLAADLEALERAETIVRQPGSRFAGETEYAFRHAFIRDAAYQLLQPEDRSTGHRRAAEYLEALGETDVLGLARHYELGGALDRAAHHYQRAAALTLDRSGEPAEVLHLVERGLACAPPGEVRGRLHTTQGWALLWAGDFMACHSAASAALPMLSADSRQWWAAIAIGIGAAGMAMDQGLLVERVEMLENAHRASAASADIEALVLDAGMHAMVCLCCSGLTERALRLRGHLETAHQRLGPADELGRAFFQMSVFWHEYFLHSNPWRMQCATKAALQSFESLGHQRFSLVMRSFHGVSTALLGDYAAGLSTIEEVVGQLPGAFLQGAHRAQQALAALQLGSPESLNKARDMATLSLALLQAPSFWRGLAYGVRALAHMGLGALALAIEDAAQAVAAFVAAPVGRPVALAWQSQILTAAGRAEEASQAAEAGLAALDEFGGTAFGDIEVYLTVAIARAARGDAVGAHVPIARAAELLHARAQEIPDEGVRARYLRQVPVHREVLRRRDVWGTRR